MDTATRIALLGDAEADVRLQMALELGQARVEDAAAPLVARFGVERDFGVRETLTWAVLRIRQSAMPLVREALDSPGWIARLQATHTLSKLGDPDDGTRLLPLVADPVAAVASRAWWAVKQCGDPEVVPALVAQLGRGSAEDRNSLYVALGHFGADAVPAVVGALRHGSTPTVRRHAADVLGGLGSPAAESASAALVEALSDADGDVRVGALSALGYLRSPAVWQVIEDTVSHADHRLQLLAGRLLERRPSRASVRRGVASGEIPTKLTDIDDPAATVGPESRSWPEPDPSLVTLEGGPWKSGLVGPLARQVEVSRPRWLARADVPAAVLEAVGAEAMDRALAAGLPEGVAGRVAAGAVEQHVHETVLLEQCSVVDPGRIVKDLLVGTEVHVVDFAGREVESVGD